MTKNYLRYSGISLRSSFFALIISFLLVVAGATESYGQIYQHNFGTTTISAHPYTVDPTSTPTPGIRDANLSGSSWSNTMTPAAAWTSFTGNGGAPSQAIALSNSSGTPTITLTLNIAAGYVASITSFDFWRQRSNTGAQNWSMTINGIAVGSGTVPTTGAMIGNTAVSNAVNNLSGSITVVMSLSGASGTGTFRMDDFTLYGSVVLGSTLSANSLTGFGDVCTGTTPGSNAFTINGTNLTAANVTVGPLAGYTFSLDNATFGATRIFSLPGTQSQIIYVRFSPTLVQSYDGNIPVSGGGAVAINVPVTGSGVNTVPSVTNGTVSGVTTSAATVSASIPAIGCTAISGYGIEYSTTPGFANGTGTQVPSSNLSGGNFSVALAALAPPGTTYYVHVYATNGGGTGYGSEISFTLQNTVPTLSVPAAGAGSLAGFGNVCVNTASSGSFNLTGNLLNGATITVGPLTGFTFSTSVAGVYTNTVSITTAGTDYSYTGGNLTGCTIYVKFIPTLVQSYNGNIPVSGGGASSINVAATGAGVNNTPVVTTDPALYISTTTATPTGSLTDAGCGILLDYGIEYSTVPFAPGTGTQVSSSNLSGTFFSINLSGLTPSSTYYYYAYATNSGGTTYGASSTFTTFGVPTKLVILSVSPASPIALTPFSITVQAQDNLGNPVDVTSETDIQLNQAAGTGSFTFPNAPLPAGTIFDGTNTAIITDLSYNIVENNVGLTATAATGMTGLGTSVVNTFNVIAYTGPTNFIWSAAGGTTWLTGSNWQTGTSPGSTTTPGLNQHLASFTSLANLNTAGVGGCGINMSTANSVLNVGAIYFAETYATAHTGDIVPLGNNSTTASGTLYLYGTSLNGVGGIAGNNFSNLLLANYMTNATTKTFEIRNVIGSGNKFMTLHIAAAGSIVAGAGRFINLHTYMTGTQPITLTGGGSFSMAPAGVSSINAFTGAITVANGTLTLGNAGAFNTATPNVITLGNSATAGILRLNGHSVTIGGLGTSGTAGIANMVDNGNAPATLTVSSAVSYNFTGALNNGSIGALSLVKAGAGTLTLAGFNQYTGATTVSNGTLRLNYTGGGTIPSSNSVTINGGILRVSTDQTLNNLTISSGTLIVDAGVTLTITGVYTTGTGNIQNNGTIRMNGSAPQTFPGVSITVTSMNNLIIQNISGVSMNKNLNVTGVLTLSSGTFTVGAYTLTINNPIAGSPSNLSANNSSSVTIAGTAAGVNLPASVSQLNNFTVSNTQGTVLQGNLHVATNLFITATAGLVDADFSVTLNGTANLTMAGGNLRIGKNGVVVPQLTGAYTLTGGTVTLDGVGIGSDAQTIRPVNYFNLTSNPTGGDRILSSSGTIGIANVFSPAIASNTYIVTGSTVDFNKASGQNIPAFTFYNLRISGGSGNVKTLAGNINIRGTFSFAANTRFSLAAFDATLTSDAAQTASVDVIPTANSIIYGGTGRFVVERYIPTGVSHGKSWQLLSTPSFGQSLKDAWQEGNAPLAYASPLLGTTLTSEKNGAVARGYDFYTPAGGPSIKTYNSTLNRWDGIDDGVTSTASLPIANKNGYMIFVRGDRSVQTSAAAATVTTLRTRGRIYSLGADAPASTNVAAGKLESIGNPYASAIDFVNLLSTSTGIDSKYYVWDPLLPSFYGYGGYQTISSSNGYKPVPGGTANYDENVSYSKIQSGQAFFVYSTPGGTVNFAEGNKVTGSQMVYRGGAVGTTPASIKTRLYGAASNLTDGNCVLFANEFNNSFDASDAVKLQNFGENIGIRNNSEKLSVDCRKPIITTDTIFYDIANVRVQGYRLEIVPSDMPAGGLEAWLVDQYLGSKTPVSLATATSINFTVTNDPGSFRNDRFYLLFKQTRPVPVQYVQLHVERTEQGMAKINWQVGGEIGVEKYEIERSLDGRVFTSIKDKTAAYNHGLMASYQDKDEEAPLSTVYYRIKTVSVNGNIQYSQVRELAAIRQASFVRVYPNPVQNRQMNLYINQLPESSYTLMLVNAAGQVVIKQLLSNIPLSGKVTVPIDTGIAPGVYQLNIFGKEAKQSIRLIIN